MSNEAFRKELQVGKGEGLLRLIQIEFRRAKGMVPSEEAKSERDLLVEAFNQEQLSLGFDCDNDGVPDDIRIFSETAKTSCCRLLPVDTSRSRRTTSSRKKKTTSKPAAKKPAAKPKKSTSTRASTRTSTRTTTRAAKPSSRSTSTTRKRSSGSRSTRSTKSTK